jgi:hypothetical protein
MQTFAGELQLHVPALPVGSTAATGPIGLATLGNNNIEHEGGCNETSA